MSRDEDDSLRVGVDVGGTFTDVVLAGAEDEVFHHVKAPSTPSNPDEGAIAGVQKLLDRTDVDLDRIDALVHGTTVATNAVIERTGATAGLIVTAGTRDVLEIRRQNRPHLYDFREQKEPSIIPRQRIHEVGGRVLSDGTVREPLAEDEVREAARELRRQNVDSVGICLLHAYADDQHERRARELVEAEFPAADVSLSSEILPEFKEYERMSTTAMNAYLVPVMDEYIDAFGKGLAELGLDVSFTIMQSNGGMMTADAARSRSVQTILSGPAAGALSGTALTDREHFVTADMGGTSFDVALCHQGDLEFTDETEIAGHVVRVPQVSVNTIGAGGGSIAWVDAGGALQVGPRSAGAQPGPVAYDRGGTEPTVTDAHVVLGRLNQESLLGGEMPVDLESARAAIRRKIAEPLDLSLAEAAQGILDVVTANMVKSIRVISVERGYDPREFSLISFGGAGPLHGAELAAELEMAESIIPYAPGVNSAVGLLAADFRNDYVETCLATLEEADFGDVQSVYADMIEEAVADLEREGIPEDRVTVQPALQARYHGQGYTLEVPVDVEALSSPNAAATIQNAFSERHEREYGFARPTEHVEVVNLTVSATGGTQSPDFRLRTTGDRDPAPTTTRPIYFEDEWHDTPVYERDDLGEDTELSGPLVVEQRDSTTVVPPETTLRLDDYRNLLLDSR